MSSSLTFKKHNIMQKTIIFGALFTIVGLSACDNVAKGTKTEATEAAATTNVAPTMNYKIDAAASKITWVGTKPTGKHTGTIAIKEGGLAYESALTAATFVLDMNTISATDLDEKSGKADLDGHLKSADFFDAAKFPDAKFELTKVENSKITGNLTLKEVTKSISFEATVKEENGVLKADAPSFVINRLDWGIKTGSKSLAATAKDKIIGDDIALTIHLEAKK
jgi:polyisoprenoid-binding protein YceI